jgi:hypothetical protein
VTDPGFGDFEPADAFDTARADPEQVARKLAELGGGKEGDRLTSGQRFDRIMIADRLLTWLRREGAG